MSMNVHFNPELQAKIEQWSSETGRPPGELVENIVAGYFDEIAQVRKTLDRRYDDMKSGKVKPIPADVAHTRLMESIDSRRRKA